MKDDTALFWGVHVRAEPFPDLRAQIVHEVNGEWEQGDRADRFAWEVSVHEYTDRTHLLSIYMRNIVLETENTKVKKNCLFKRSSPINRLVGETEPCKLQAVAGHMMESDRCGITVTHQLPGETKQEGHICGGRELRKGCVCV